MKSKVLLTVWCHISCEAAGEFWHWSLSGVKGLKIWNRSPQIFFNEDCWQNSHSGMFFGKWPCHVDETPWKSNIENGAVLSCRALQDAHSRLLGQFLALFSRCNIENGAVLSCRALQDAHSRLLGQFLALFSRCNIENGAVLSCRALQDAHSRLLGQFPALFSRCNIENGAVLSCRALQDAHSRLLGQFLALFSRCNIENGAVLSCRALQDAHSRLLGQFLALFSASWIRKCNGREGEVMAVDINQWQCRILWLSIGHRFIELNQYQLIDWHRFLSIYRLTFQSSILYQYCMCLE